MTEKEWLQCTDTLRMVDWLRTKLNITPKNSKESFSRFVASMRKLYWAEDDKHIADFSYLDVKVSVWLHMDALKNNSYGADKHEDVRPAVIRDVFGNPFRAATITIHLSETSVDLLGVVQQAIVDKNFDRLASISPILADSLEDDGVTPFISCTYCDGAGVLDNVPRSRLTCPHCNDGVWSNPLLQHLRDPGQHYAGCWAVHLLEEMLKQPCSL